MLLMQHYDEAVRTGEIRDDAAQRVIIQALQAVSDALANAADSWFHWRAQEPLRGIYLHGSVGAGKSFLMDLFFQHVDERRKARVHFHEFMQQVHTELRYVQGASDPLKRVAESIAKSTRLLCLDEFLVNDIATAMILGEFLKHLLARGVVLVVTSNTPPDELYKNGLQRVRFLPAITLLKSHCDVFYLQASRDYRLGRDVRAQTYLHPLGEETERRMAQQFNAFAPGLPEEADLLVHGRIIPFVKRCQRVVWFRFEEICNLPRSQLDYLDLAGQFDVILVSDIPQLQVHDTVKALLLMHFIDVMYDRRVRVIMSSAVPIELLYQVGEVAKPFWRTQSRLQEMQSADYASK